MGASQEPDLTALNVLYGKHARAIGWLNAEPELEPLGPLHLTGWQRLRRAVEAQTLEDMKRWNDPCAVVMNLEDVVSTGRITLQVTDYAAVSALRADAREKGAPPPVMLSAAAVVTGPDGTLLLHQRAITSSTYPGALHTFGGGYVPKRERRPDVEDLSLADTIRREFQEETRTALTEAMETHRLWVAEPATGFVQCLYLGLRASSQNTSERWEGKTIVVATEQDLVELLRDTRRWVPTGHMHVVAWLMVGAPGFAALTEQRAKMLAAEVMAGGAPGGWAEAWTAHPPEPAPRHQDVLGGKSTGERADFVALSSRSAMELGCDVAGPPTIDLLGAVNTAVTVAPKHRDFDGLVVDLRGEPGSDDVFRAIVGLRSKFLSWLGKQNAVPTSNVPLVLIGSAVELDAARRWSVRHGGPALWFSLGVELVEASQDGVPWQAVRAAVDRLKSHPVVQMSTRIHTLFPSNSLPVTCLAWHDGVPVAPALNDTDRPGEMKELGFPCPSTFELQGGLSTPLPADLRDAVVRYCVVALAGDQGRKTGACGYTSLPGRGWWYSEGTGLDIVEGVDWIIVHAKVTLAQAQAAAAYLRWAWLQDYVFMTFDGHAVGF